MCACEDHTGEIPAANDEEPEEEEEKKEENDDFFEEGDGDSMSDSNEQNGEQPVFTIEKLMSSEPKN